MCARAIHTFLIRTFERASLLPVAERLHLNVIEKPEHEQDDDGNTGHRHKRGYTITQRVYTQFTGVGVAEIVEAAVPHI